MVRVRGRAACSEAPHRGDSPTVAGRRQGPAADARPRGTQGKRGAAERVAPCHGQTNAVKPDMVRTAGSYSLRAIRKSFSTMRLRSPAPWAFPNHGADREREITLKKFDVVALAGN